MTQLISFEEARRILAEARTFPDLMVMELLEGYEYSIDCLADGKEGCSPPFRAARRADVCGCLSAMPDLWSSRPRWLKRTGSLTILISR